MPKIRFRFCVKLRVKPKGKGGIIVSAIKNIRKKLVPPGPVIDFHVHPWSSVGVRLADTPEDNARCFLQAADDAGISRMVVHDVGSSSLPSPAPADLTRINDLLLRVCSVDPARFIPFAYLNPGYPEESLRELDRCIGNGMRGIKLWIGRRINHAGGLLIARRAAELGIPIVQHCSDRPGGNLPGETSPADAVELAAICPEVKLVLAHLNNIGLRGIEVIRPYKNILVDTSGGDPLAGFVRAAIDRLGVARVVFGSDMPCRCFGSQLGKVLNGSLTPEEVEKVLRLNAEALPRACPD